MKNNHFQKGALVLLCTFIFTSSIFFFSCSNTDSANLVEDWPDQMQLKGNDYNSFASQFNERFASLPLHQQELLGSFIQSKNSASTLNTSGRTNVASTCNCQPGQNTCSSSTWWSDCCICCSGGVSAACSTSGPIVTCKCNQGDNTTREGKMAIELDNFVTIYPNHFKELFDFAIQNSIDLKNIEVLFAEVMKRNI
jgi:hypothetical protein